MTGFLVRFGLLILAGIIIFLARRLHKKAAGKSEKMQKTIATIAGFFGGVALVGTVAGTWMNNISRASPYVAAAAFFLAAGGLLIDWWTDKKPDKFAFYCAILLPLAMVYGLAQAQAVVSELGRNAQQVSSTIGQQAPAPRTGR